MIEIKNKGIRIRWTNEDIENYVSQTDCKLISIEREYKKGTYVKLLCKCGNSFRTKLGNFTNNGKRQCNECGKEIKYSKLRTPFYVVKEFFETQGYVLLSTEYKNDRQYMDTICPKGHSYKVRYNKFKTGDRCPICAGNYKNHEMYKKQIENIRNNEFEVIEEYQKSNIPIIHKHKICDKEFSISPTNFLNHPRCPRCDKFRRWDTELIKEKIFEMYNGEYELLEDFKTTKQKHLLLHKICGNKYETNLDNFLQGKKCPFCFGYISWTTELYKEKVEEITNGEYTILNEYVNSKTKVLHKHLTCENEFLMIPSAFISHEQRCPKCNKFSKGERKITDWLKEHQINFTPEYKFDDLKSDKDYPLRFDFAIFKDGLLFSLIEFDGKQHFEWIKHMMPYNEFLLVQQRDKLKNEYCINNNIPLLRINYKQLKQVNNILDKELSDVVNSI